MLDMTITNPPQTREQPRVEQLLLKLAQSEAERPTPNAPRYSIESFEIVTACLMQMEATILGLRELRSYFGTQVGSHILEILIEEADAKITDIKRRIAQ